MKSARGTIACGARPAFSLIEVLIGILILSLGLLGLGSIIPAVVQQQRAGADLTLGVAAAGDAEKYLTTRPDLDPTSPGDVGWDMWLADNTWSTGADAYLWQSWRIYRNPPELDGAGPNATADFMFYVVDANGDPHYAAIRLADRLWPSLSRQGSVTIPLGLDPYKPQMVWDFVGRRMPTAVGEPQKLQVALFVRRIDVGIRIDPDPNTGPNPARSFTLYDELAERPGLLPQGWYRLPVCANGPYPFWPMNGGAGAGSDYLPTNNGVLSGGGLNYSGPIFLAANPNGDTLDFPGINVSDNRFRLVSQPGQKIIDNLGNIYTVIGEPENTAGAGGGQRLPATVRIDPPVPAWVPAATSPDPTNLPPGAPNPAKIHQIVFVPQIPAAVKVFTITRPVP